MPGLVASQRSQFSPTSPTEVNTNGFCHPANKTGRPPANDKAAHGTHVRGGLWSSSGIDFTIMPPSRHRKSHQTCNQSPKH